MTLTGSSHKGGALAQFRQVYCWQLKKNRILSIVYGALTLLCCTIMYLCRVVSQYRYYFMGDAGEWEGLNEAQIKELFSQDAACYLNEQIYMAMIPLALIFLVAFLVTAFGYMHRRRSVDLFHALPIRRTPMLLGGLAAGYTVLALVVILNSLLCGIIGLALGAETPFTFPWLLSGIGYQLLLLAAAMVLTLFLMVASGTLVNAVFSGILLSLGWPILCFCGALIIQMTLPGSTLAASGTVITALVPYLAIFQPFLDYDPAVFATTYTEITSSAGASGSGGYGIGGYGIGPLLVLWWCLFTVLLLAASILVYRKRKSEYAENSFSFPALRTVIQFLISAACGLGCGVIFGEILNQNWVFFLAVLVGSAVAHVVSQMLWAKGLRNFKKSLPVYGVLVASLCVFFVGLATGGLGYVTRIPNPTRVENVSVELPDYYYGGSLESYLGRYAGIEVWYESSSYGGEDADCLPIKMQLKSETSVKTVEEMHQALIDYYDKPYLPYRGDGEWYDNYACTVRYQLSNGKTLERTYSLPMAIPDASSGETVQDLDFPEETLNTMTAVMALDEYQAYSLFYYQDASRITDVTLDRLDGKGEYMGEQELTKKQQKKLWDTFQKELNSKQFHYSVQDSSGVTMEGETSYCINVDSTWQSRKWPDALRELVMSQVQDYFPKAYWDNLTIEGLTGGTMFVPESCTQTRKLIEQYIGDNVEYIPYDDETYD